MRFVIYFSIGVLRTSQVSESLVRETSARQNVVLKKKLTIFEYRRDRNISIYIWTTFSHDANTYQIAYESNIAIWENLVTRNCVLEFWLLTELSEIKPILHEPSTMLVMLKYLICLRLL